MARRTCPRSGKHFYRDELGAKIALSRVTNKGALRVYKCNLCPGYHITSQPKRTERIIPPSIDSRL